MSLTETLISAAQACEILAVSRSTLLRMQADPGSGLPAPRFIGRRKFFRRDEIVHYLDNLPTVSPAKSK